MRASGVSRFKLDGSEALVTGAGRGIGRSIALGLAEAGASVTLVARSAKDIEEVACEIRSLGGRASACPLDVTDIPAVTEFFKCRTPFHVLINNAGTNRPKPVFDVTEDDFDAVLGLNLRAAFFVARACAARLVDEGTKGSLIHMGSQMGHVGAANRTLYCASKAALEGFNKSLAVELAPFGIRSNTICPTFIETPMTRPFFEDTKFLGRVMDKIKLGRLGQPEDIVGAAIFLSSTASSMMTGTSLLIDGGWTAE